MQFNEIAKKTKYCLNVYTVNLKMDSKKSVHLKLVEDEYLNDC